jgi:hypothetical protein
MTAYDIVNYINELPQKSVVVIETEDHLFFFSVAKTRAEAVGDSTLKLDGLIGLTFITIASLQHVHTRKPSRAQDNRREAARYAFDQSLSPCPLCLCGEDKEPTAPDTMTPNQLRQALKELNGERACTFGITGMPEAAACLTVQRAMLVPEETDQLIKLTDGASIYVKVTLGPSGRNVVLEKSFGSPTVTKDGVTVAKEIELEDAYENMGAQMVKEVASKTSNVAGDGTTTATIYAEAIFEEGLKNVAAGANAMQVKRGIDKAVEAIVEELKKMSKPIEDSSKEIAQVGTCAPTRTPRSAR